MHVEELALAERRPWKNGAGQTRELLAWPSAEGWQLRISVADIVAAAPFSTFPDTDRWIAVLTGDGIALSVDGFRAVELRADDEAMFGFAGESATSCELLGSATTDFNVMVDRRHWRAVITPLGRRPRLQSSARFLACFVASAAVIRASSTAARAVTSAAVVWSDRLDMPVGEIWIEGEVPRGWWIELFPQEAANV